jgi:hypothetical protein
MIRLFNRGDLVRYHGASRAVLHSANEVYPFAVVIRAEPLVLASWDGRMRWESTLRPQFLIRVGRAPMLVTLRLWLQRRSA